MLTPRDYYGDIIQQRPWSDALLTQSIPVELIDMLSRFTVFSSRLPASLSFALFSTTASSSNPSAAYLKKMSVKQFVEVNINNMFPDEC